MAWASEEPVYGSDAVSLEIIYGSQCKIFINQYDLVQIQIIWKKFGKGTAL